MRKQQKKLFRRDRYLGVRGGSAQFYLIRCAKCREVIALYQKDGQGQLVRMYLDRIFEPKDLIDALSKIRDKKSMKSLTCQGCGALIGVPMVYEREDRLAFRLVRGSFIRERDK
jgi:ribosomal protein S27E